MFIEHWEYCYQDVAKLIWRSCGRIGNWKVKRKWVHNMRKLEVCTRLVYVPSKACINSYIGNVAISSCIKAGAKQMVLRKQVMRWKCQRGLPNDSWGKVTTPIVMNVQETPAKPTWRRRSLCAENSPSVIRRSRRKGPIDSTHPIRTINCRVLCLLGICHPP